LVIAIVGESLLSSPVLDSRYLLAELRSVRQEVERAEVPRDTRNMACLEEMLRRCFHSGAFHRYLKTFRKGLEKKLKETDL